jgi:hypothetical protein
MNKRQRKKADKKLWKQVFVGNESYYGLMATETIQITTVELKNWLRSVLGHYEEPECSEADECEIIFS